MIITITTIAQHLRSLTAFSGKCVDRIVKCGSVYNSSIWLVRCYLGAPSHSRVGPMQAPCYHAIMLSAITHTQPSNGIAHHRCSIEATLVTANHATHRSLSFGSKIFASYAMSYGKCLVLMPWLSTREANQRKNETPNTLWMKGAMS